MLEAPNAFAGRNAFDAIWVMRYDVPDAEIDAMADADMQALAAASRDQDAPVSFTTAATRYPDLRPLDGDVMPCGSDGSGCLEKVRASRDDYRDLVQANARLIERVEALSVYDHYASRPPADPRVPFPEFTLLAWPVTAHAVQFAQGDQLGAVAATCRELATWRRIGVHGDTLITLITRMFGIALATDGYGALLARMLATLPRDVPLPAACQAALAAPAAADASICPTMRGEFAWSLGVTDAMPEMRQHSASRWLVLDRKGTRALMAEQMHAACTLQDVPLKADRRASLLNRQTPIWQRFECIANSVGCMLSDIAGPAYDVYAWRALDQNARLQLLATLAWLRDQSDVDTLAERIARRPADLPSPGRDVTVSVDGRSLVIAQYDSSRSDTWSLPLPAYLVESTAASD